MSVHEILIVVMAIFAALGAIDRIFGNRLGLGHPFEEGILAMGTLALAMLGIISLADQLGDDAVAEKGRSLFKVIIAVYVIAIIGVASYTFVLINPALAVIAYVIVCISMVVSIVSYFLYLSLLSKAKKMLAK